MSNLVPELRPDINGKMVTRHVRADSPVAGTKNFPAPAVTASPTKANDFNEVKASLTNILEHYLVMAAGGGDKDDYSSDDGGGDEDDFWSMDDDDDDEELGWDPESLLSLNSIEGALSKLPERTVKLMREKMESTPYLDDYEIALLHALTYEGNASQLIEYMTYFHSKVSDLFPNRDLLGDPDVNTYTLIRDYMQGLRNYESIGYKLPDDIFEATDEECTTMDALHYLNGQIGDDEGHVEPEIGRIVLERPDSVDDVIEIVENRGTRNAALIREILDSSTPAVRDGIL